MAFPMIKKKKKKKRASKQTKLTFLVEHWRGEEKQDKIGVLLVRASRLFPRNELRHLLGQLPKFFKIYVAVVEPGNKIVIRFEYIII